MLRRSAARSPSTAFAAATAIGAKTPPAGTASPGRCRRITASVPGYSRLQLSASIGGVITQPGETVEQAVSRADKLMYQAKNRKNMVVTEDNGGRLRRAGQQARLQGCLLTGHRGADDPARRLRAVQPPAAGMSGRYSGRLKGRNRRAGERRFVKFASP